MKKYRIFIVLVVIGVCVAAISVAASRPDYRAWLQKADKPVVEALNRGANAFAAGKLEKAEKAYMQAEQIATAADTTANLEWQRKSRGASPEWVKKNSVSPRDRFLTGKDNPLYHNGMLYFRSRISEATYGLALTRFHQLRYKYRVGDSGGFAPPEKELAPALDALERGLNATPKSESLRLLKAEILAGAGRYNQAIKILEETLLIDPQSAEAYNQLGMIYSSRVFMIDAEQWKKNRDKALEMFKRATMGTALDGGRLPDPFYNLGMYYATPDPGRAGNARPAAADAATAKKYLSEYLKLCKDRNAPGAQQAQKTLQRLP